MFKWSTQVSITWYVKAPAVSSQFDRERPPHHITFHNFIQSGGAISQKILHFTRGSSYTIVKLYLARIFTRIQSIFVQLFLSFLSLLFSDRAPQKNKKRRGTQNSIHRASFSSLFYRQRLSHSVWLAILTQNLRISTNNKH